MTYYHFDIPNDIRTNQYIMDADFWRINYYKKKGFFDKLCSYEIRFQNGIVISQKMVCSSDAI